MLVGPTLQVSWLSGFPFLGSLHWLVGGLDLGVGGISYVELLILYELRAGERLSLEKAHHRYLDQGVQFQCRLFRLVQALILGALVAFLGSLVRFLDRLPGGLIRFLPCRIGTNHIRLRHLGWEKCGHGLTSRPKETSDPVFLDSLLEVLVTQ